MIKSNTHLPARKAIHFHSCEGDSLKASLATCARFNRTSRRFSQGCDAVFWLDGTKKGHARHVLGVLRETGFPLIRAVFVSSDPAVLQQIATEQELARLRYFWNAYAIGDPHQHLHMLSSALGPRLEAVDLPQAQVATLKPLAQQLGLRVHYQAF